MAIIGLDDLLDDVHYVYNSLKEVVAQVTKKLQLLVDSEAADPDADNSNLPFTLPYQYYATHYTAFPAKTVTHDYDPYTSGNHKTAFAYQLTLNDNVLTMSGLTAIGMVEGSGWHLLSPEQREASYNQMKSYYEGQTINIISNYPDIATLFSHTSGYFQFFPTGKQTSDIYYKYQTLTGDTVSGGIATIMHSAEYTPYIDDSTGYLYNSGSFNQLRSGQTSYIQKQPFEGVFGNLTSARAWVNANNATHNYEQSYLVYGGSMTVLYGDNYIIYVVPSGVKVTYNLMKNITQNIATTINSDNPDIPVIKVPTYEENKYGPGPEPSDIDKDIEVDMDLNDAAYGAGLSHYYVTTVGSTVLNDISAAMSTWDIVNTGKDLYKNLISCRITKVGPIPSESSTFVIYGEELQYNGSPITITKITGNPSMDLGEYEILPKFHDFRDYAPFTKLEMFIPYCGWVSLPSHCMSSEEDPKIITGTLLCDIIAGTCKAIIKCNDTVVAEASGFTAIDVPFTGENVGMKMAGIASSITSYGNQAAKTVGSVASGGMAGGAGAGAALAGGLVGMLGSYAQMYSAFNANYTEICGKTGDGCNVAGLGSVYIKIQRPKAGETESPYYVPANYAHTTGFMSMKQKKISECEGLIVCANVDTSGIFGATARERAEIKRLLESGIYVNLTPPEPPEP